MQAMDKPKLDFGRDTHSYHLWLSSAELLGDLNATEALDLLISHLNLTAPIFSSSMNHQPALIGLIKMGPMAVPKLSEALRHNTDPQVRYSVIYAIATIGGESARTALKECLISETDDCAKRLVRVSLDSFDEQGNIKDRMAWFANFTCNH